VALVVAIAARCRPVWVRLAGRCTGAEVAAHSRPDSAIAGVVRPRRVGWRQQRRRRLQPAMVRWVVGKLRCPAV
jgi:hypothetical protein